MDGRQRAAAALVPCTCGELVQGLLEGEPFLVSCPIDRYSRVTVTLEGAGAPVAPLAAPAAREDGASLPHPKALQAARAALTALGLGDVGFSLEVSCPLPAGKGFGTSTADVVGAIVAASRAAGLALGPADVARLAVDVEPSDGTMFPGLALFDHRRGRRWEVLAPAPPLLLAVLEFGGEVDTMEYNAGLDLDRWRSMEREHTRALELLREGLRRQRPDLVGSAATTSALAHQRLLPKPELEQTIALAADYRALGVCAAHSGTALGVLLGPGEMQQAQRLLAAARRRLQGLQQAWVSRLVDGGARPS